MATSSWNGGINGVSGTRFSLGWTPKLAPEARLATVRAFLRALGLVYLVSFLSFGVQSAGLLGARGILPFGDYLKAARDSLGAAAYWNVPTVLWLYPTDTAMHAVWLAGCAAALIALWGRWQRAALTVCLVLWLSLCSVGQDFYSFQWDILLCEAGFLAIFADASRVRIWLFRWLLFRLMFFSGAVKLLSGDPIWRDVTALHYHYQTQPLPTPLAWYMQQLPAWFQKASVGVVFVVELLVPFLFFAPRRIRRVAAWVTIGFQALILLTGNYTFFNWLTIALCVWLFVEPEPMRERLTQPGCHYRAGYGNRRVERSAVPATLLRAAASRRRDYPANRRFVPRGQFLRPVRGDDHHAAGDRRGGLERRDKLAGLRVPVQARRCQSPPADRRAVSAQARLADVVRRSGKLPEQSLVCKLHVTAATRRAERIAAIELQPVPQGPSEVSTGEDLLIHLYSLR